MSPLIGNEEPTLKVEKKLKKRGFEKPVFEFKKSGQKWSLEKVYSKPPDFRRIHIRGFEDGRIECEEETLYPNHFGFIAKPKPCPPEILKEIENESYKCFNDKDKTICEIKLTAK